MIPKRSPAPARMVVLDKPEGPTSFDLVRSVRALSGCARVGHGGTLDPFASGVLVLGLGPATRLLPFATAGRKRYRATFEFGVGTDSHDRTGRVVATQPAHLDAAVLREVLDGFVGEIQQRPPRVSAIKVDGERSYRRHREGRADAPLASRAVHIHRIEMRTFAPPCVDILVECGSGTYIRALARDVGEALGCPAHVSALRREAAEPFTLDDAVSLEDLREHWPAGPGVFEPSVLARHWPRLELTDDEVSHVRSGGQPLASWAARVGWSVLPETVALVDGTGRLVAVAQPKDLALRLAVVLPAIAESHGHP